MTFSETLVKRKLTDTDKKNVKLIFFGLIVSSIVFILILPLYFLSIGLPLAPTASLLVFAVIVFILWRKLKKMQLEFEYIITEGVMDVDKIIARKKRQRLISFDLKEISDIGVYDKNAFKNKSFDLSIHAERDEKGNGNYFITIYTPKTKNTLIVFSPDDNMMEMLKTGVPRNFLNNLPRN